MFETILLLMKKLPPDRLMEVTHGDYAWTARFDWQPPIKNVPLPKVYDKPLPPDFLTFLNQVMDGGTLYYDILSGQWGYRIYSIEELGSKQEIWKLSLGKKWRDQFIAFAELYGEANVLLFDRNLPTADSSSVAVKEGNPNDLPENWPILSRSFHEWLEHLVTAQGAKYWEWK